MAKICLPKSVQQSIPNAADQADSYEQPGRYLGQLIKR